jgi:hypothetical protein
MWSATAFNFLNEKMTRRWEITHLIMETYTLKKTVTFEYRPDDVVPTSENEVFVHVGESFNETEVRKGTQFCVFLREDDCVDMDGPDITLSVSEYKFDELFERVV